MQIIKDWYKRRFSDPQVVILLLLLVIGFVVVLAFGRILAPLLTAIVFAYLLESTVQRLELWGVRRIVGVLLVFLGFVVVQTFLIFGVVPVLVRQMTQFVQQTPQYVGRFQDLMKGLPERYPNLVTEVQIEQFLAEIGNDISGLGQLALSQTSSAVSLVLALIVFLVLVPILVFFLLKDKDKIIDWAKGYLPKERLLVNRVWGEVDDQIGNYVRGKTLEILIVGFVSFVTFQLLGLQYAILLATLVGFSVLIPYIGAAIVTLPIAIIAYSQFGWTSEFAAVMVAYGIIQLLDGNVLVPFMFSEVVDLHPVAIIVAVLLFGGVWGFWGIFFAIPLATLFQAVIRALPIRAGEPVEDTETEGSPVLADP